MIAWVYGSGFPKSLNVSKAIDKSAGVEREVVGKRNNGASASGFSSGYESSHNTGRGQRTGVFKSDNPSLVDITAPATPEAIQWNGWGTALKPALEPITVARKPLEENTVANNVLKHGTGAINIDGCRVFSEDVNKERKRHGGGIKQNHSSFYLPDSKEMIPPGRWPANLIHDGSAEVLRHFPDDEESSAARFFYCPKTQQKDRGENKHPTVKPTELMRYLCRLVTPPGGTVLDPFMGSGSTGKAAQQEDFHFIGFEIDSSYFKIAERRINTATKGQQLLLFKNNEYTLLA